MTTTCRSIDISRFTEFDQNVIQQFELMCLICRSVPLPEDVVLTKGCNHMFCKSCLMTSYATKQACPTCRHPLSTNSLQETIDSRTNMRRMLSSLKVRCNEQNTCSWIGTMDDLTKHVLSCPNTESFPCPNGCNYQQNRNTWQSHSTICTFRNIICEHCTRQITPATINEHLTICPELVVDCPYKTSGCTFRAKRIALSEHLTSSTLIHAEQSNTTIWELRQEMLGTHVIQMPTLMQVLPDTQKKIGTLLDKTWCIQVKNVNEQLSVCVNIVKVSDVIDTTIAASFSMRMNWTAKHPTDSSQSINRVTEWRNVSGCATLRTNLSLPLTWLVPNKGLTIIINRLMLYDWTFPDSSV